MWFKKSITPKVSHQEDFEFLAERDMARLLEAPTGARYLTYAVFLCLILSIGWAHQAKIDEIAVGHGKVVPAKQLQVLQSLEGGIISEVFVRPGDIVAKGDILLKIDDTQFKADLQKHAREIQILKAQKERLLAEIGSKELRFSSQITRDIPDFIQQQKEIHAAKKLEFENLEQSLKLDKEKNSHDIRKARQQIEIVENNLLLARKELEIAESLRSQNGVSEIELLTRKNKVNDLMGEIAKIEIEVSQIKNNQTKLINEHNKKLIETRNQSQEQLNSILAKIENVSQSRLIAQDRLDRAAIRSPVNGIVQRVLANTISSVFKSGADLVEIVPSGGALLIEAKILPVDIGFLRTNQKAIVKFTAYDHTIYGGLSGYIEHISADSVTENENSFYIIRVRTESNEILFNGKPLKIIPGMNAKVDIITGNRSVLNSILRPVLRGTSETLGVS